MEIDIATITAKNVWDLNSCSICFYIVDQKRLDAWETSNDKCNTKESFTAKAMSSTDPVPH